MILIEKNDVVPGAQIDALQTMYPTRMFVAAPGHQNEDPTRTTYGFVLRGTAGITYHGISAILEEGSYFAIPGAFELHYEDLTGFNTRVVLIERFGYRGMLNIGKIEERGRLAYIDGCSDTPLVMPNRLGDPCLNFLYFPRGINQTQHIHPSIRMGIVARGYGEAWQQEDNYGHGWVKPLEAGNIFMLEESELHSFRTTTNRQGENDPGMTIIAYHPDSDTGPTDLDQPMLNRTYINHGQPGGQSGAR